MLRSVDRTAVADQGDWQRARDRNERLADMIKRRRTETDQEFFMAGSLVTAVRRTLADLAPDPDGQPRAVPDL
jgi:hypothetical protein